MCTFKVHICTICVLHYNVLIKYNTSIAYKVTSWEVNQGKKLGVCIMGKNNEVALSLLKVRGGLELEDISWLDDESLQCLLQCMYCNLEAVCTDFSHKAYEGCMDSVTIREFFLNDYLYCVNLITQLNSKVSHL